MGIDNYPDSFGALCELRGCEEAVSYYRLGALQEKGLVQLQKLPFSIKILLEAVLRAEDGVHVTRENVTELASYDPQNPADIVIPFKPARVLLQDFTGVPAVVDLAAMRSAMARLGGDPGKINPTIPVDLVVDHSIQVDAFAHSQALQDNTELEFKRNRERYEFLRWGGEAFENFSVIPPASGICHQVNLEYLAEVVARVEQKGSSIVFPDSVVGTDSHTPMVNGLGVAGWGVGGIEAEAVMLGQPLYMVAPKVVGVRLTGRMKEGTQATDLVLAVTEMLRKTGVVGKFVEFFGEGLDHLTVPDRATISNMAPEYGATMGFFPVDERSIGYLAATGRSEEVLRRVRTYCEAQGLFRTRDTEHPHFEQVLELDLSIVETSLAGPKRPQDRIPLGAMKKEWQASLRAAPSKRGFGLKEDESRAEATVHFEDSRAATVGHGAVGIAAITSCTNTSNPSVLLAAGLLARNALEKGLERKPWVKTSLAPGSLVVTEYLARTGLLGPLESLGFHVVGYGCTTCIGNSGPLPRPMASVVEEDNIIAASVISGNRNFEGRINPLIKASYLASPALVIAYALAGTVDVDLVTEPLGHEPDGSPVYLRDIWPTNDEVRELMETALTPEMFREKYTGIEQSNEEWNRVKQSGLELYEWNDESTYIQEPPFFEKMTLAVQPILPIEKARVLAFLGDSVTTDHISPAGAIPQGGPAGQFLLSNSVKPEDFNSFGSRRGNDRVMVRGTFANIRLRNRLAEGVEGGYTMHPVTGEVDSIFEAANAYRDNDTPTVVLAGKDYGMGSSRDWAAKGTLLLGVRAVIAESFERIHRSNLVGMGLLPLEFEDGENAETLGLNGRETMAILIDDTVRPRQKLDVRASRSDGFEKEFNVICRLDSEIDVEYYRNGGILHTVLRRMLKDASH